MEQEKKKYEEPRMEVMELPLPKLLSDSPGGLGGPHNYGNGKDPFSN